MLRRCVCGLLGTGRAGREGTWLGHVAGGPSWMQGGKGRLTLAVNAIAAAVLEALAVDTIAACAWGWEGVGEHRF